MPSQEAIRAARERVRLSLGECSGTHIAYQGLPSDQIAELYERDRDLIVRRYLIEHPTDDDEPVTMEDVEKVFHDDEVFQDPDAWGAVSQREGQLGIVIESWIPLNTKRDLRRLCAAISDQLRES